jgi:hypothetical protein
MAVFSLARLGSNGHHSDGADRYNGLVEQLDSNNYECDRS